MVDIAILTEKRYLNPQPNNWYTENILEEEELIQNELKKLNIYSQRVAWDENVKLVGFQYALFRTTWNYFDELNSFLTFLKKSKSVVRFINPYDQIIWNLDKKYLIDLFNRGINIPRTQIIKKGSLTVSLAEFCNKNRWKDIVIKPCVSAAAWNTHYIAQNKRTEFEHTFNSLIKSRNMIVQEFQKNIKSFGEISMIMIGGLYTHAVVKHAKSGDFRVQDDFGGSVATHHATKQQIEFANSVLSALSFKPVYARVDMILDNNNSLALSELELIEPELWFRLHPMAAKKLAAEIKRRYF